MLYAPAPRISEITNHDPRFKAPYEMVSGTERYVDGEYLYTDYLYDDGEGYPDDFERYAGNAGDLLEWRMSTRGPGLAVRLSLTSLVKRDSTIAVVAFDSDDNGSTGSATLPRDPGLPFPGTDAVLTTWGTGAEWSTWTGAEWHSVPLESRADLSSNQVTVDVPPSIARPTGKWRATLAIGLYDVDTGGWLPPSTGTGSAITNLGFRFGVAQEGTSPSQGQTTALTTSSPTTYSHLLDFDLMRAGGELDNVSQHGLIYRMYASRLRQATYVDEATPGQYDETTVREGKFLGPVGSQYLSRLQPYAVYVPAAYDSRDPAPLTLAMHGQDADYWWLTSSGWTQGVGEGRGSILLSPSGRGPRGWFLGQSEYDVFEAWNDVATHYRIDPRRTVSFGVSMGGYGAYRLGLRYPHLFSRIVAYIPGIQRTQTPGAGNTAIAIPGINENETNVNQWVENARNVPVFHLADMLSETTFYPAHFLHVVGPPEADRQSLDSLGYRYRFWSMAADHIIGLTLSDFPEVVDFMGREVIEPEPFHVTYSRVPRADRRELGLVPDRAYWVSDIAVRDEAAGPGRVDAVSSGFGLLDPSSTVSQGAGLASGTVPYVSQERVWASPEQVQPRNRVVVDVINISSLVIDPKAAMLGCDADVEILSDGPVTVVLKGCHRRIVHGG